jgi:molecular chaperone HscB
VVSPSTSESAKRLSAGGSDAFGLLGLAPRYDIDADTLEKAFFERSKELHPDRFAQAPAAERVVALSKSRALNDAYQLLKKPASRAEYLLAREGFVIGDNERIDPALVMDLLEEREELAEARHAGKLERVAELQRGMKARRKAAFATIATLFAEPRPGTAGTARPVDWAAIKQQLILLRYVERYLEECDSALDED